MKKNYQELSEELSEKVSQWIFSSHSFEEIEEELLELDGSIHQLLLLVGGKVIGRVLNRLAEKYSRDDFPSGTELHSHKIIQYQCLFGQIDIDSPYFYHRQLKQGYRPLKQLGISHRRKSVCLERALSGFGAEESFRQSAHRFEEHYYWHPSESGIRTTTLKWGASAEHHLQKRLESIELEETPPAEILIVQTDGCHIPIGKWSKVHGKKKRELEWKEVRTSLVCKPGEVDPTYLCKRAGYPEVIEDLRSVCLQKGLTPKTLVVAVADGGQGLKEEMEAQFQPLQFILDYPHLKQHLYETAEACGLEKTGSIRQWVERQTDKIFKGHVQKVIKNLKAQQKRKPVHRRKRLIAYLKRFKDCIHYEKYKQHQWPIGSGKIESAHRFIPQKRMKIAGAWWDINSVNPMLALRVARQNGWWKDVQEMTKAA